MAWPTGQDYNEAIQSPQTVFSDADLKGGRAETNQHGFPRPRAGAFATVYRMENGGRAWAVRCFNRDTRDLQERYSAISTFLKRETLPYFADFEYLPQGIRVKGTWYPILKMEWLQGEPLHIYVEKHLKDSASLLRLSTEWLLMAKCLANAGIAHGDLQHGNVLLVGSKLKLIDYDGMYVPALKGKLSNETGQPNYQLPGRSALDYGPHLDNFSEWVVLVSLLALSADPSIWKTFRGGDECLIFRKTDFETPATSQLFRTLERSNDQQVAALISLFKTYLSLTPSAVPSVDGSFVSPTPAPQATSRTNQPDWLKDHLGRPTATVAAPTAKHEQAGSALSGDWLLDFTAPGGEILRFEGSLVRARLFTLAALGLTLLLLRFPLSALTGIIDFLVWLSLSLVLRRDYKVRPETNKLDELLKKIAAVKTELVDAKLDLDEESKNCDKFHSSIINKKRLSDQARQQIQIEEQNKAKSASERHQSTTKGFSERLNNLAAQELADLAAIQNNLGRTLLQRKADLIKLDQSETNESSGLLKQKCDAHMSNRLSNASLADASITGIGPSLKKELWRSGIRSAMQVSRSSALGVKGIGATKADALMTWRMMIENQARSTMPTLTNQEKAVIADKYKAQRKALRDEICSRETVIDREQRSVRDRYAPMKEALTVSIKDVATTAAIELRSIADKFADRYTKFDGEARKTGDQAQRELAALDGQLATLARSVTGIQWRMGKLSREYKSFKSITFKAYLTRVFIWR
jgi:hypothetical protein